MCNGLAEAQALFFSGVAQLFHATARRSVIAGVLRVALIRFTASKSSAISAAE